MFHRDPSGVVRGRKFVASAIALAVGAVTLVGVYTLQPANAATENCRVVKGEGTVDDPNAKNLYFFNRYCDVSDEGVVFGADPFNDPDFLDKRIGFKPKGESAFYCQVETKGAIAAEYDNPWYLLTAVEKINQPNLNPEIHDDVHGWGWLNASKVAHGKDGGEVPGVPKCDNNNTDAYTDEGDSKVVEPKSSSNRNANEQRARTVRGSNEPEISETTNRNTNSQANSQSRGDGPQGVDRNAPMRANNAGYECTPGNVTFPGQRSSHETAVCDAWKSAPVYDNGKVFGTLDAGERHFVCQTDTLGDNPVTTNGDNSRNENNWWLKTKANRLSSGNKITEQNGWGYVPATYIAQGGDHDPDVEGSGKVDGVRVCNSSEI